MHFLGVRRNDTEIAWSILAAQGYARSEDIDNADIALLVTCAIREGAENKVFTRLSQLNAIKKSQQKKAQYVCLSERMP